MPLLQNLCFYWQVFSPDQQTINMTPLNAHILTPKINHVLFSSSRHMAPTRTVYRSCSLTSGTFRSQSTDTYLCTHMPALCDTLRQQRRAILRSALGTIRTAGSPQGSEWIDASSGPASALPCLACHSSCWWLARRTATENRSQCGDQGYWSSSEELTQSCLLPQRCGSGTLHRWKTEEGEWVITRVRAPVLPKQKKKAQPTTMVLLPACHVWVFETVITEIQQWETQMWRKEKYKKAGCDPLNLSQYRLKKLRRRGKEQREEVSGFYGGPKLIWDDKLWAKFNAPQWLIKSKQKHCKVCVFTCASMCTWKESEHTPKPANTHIIIYTKPLKKQADKFILAQIALDFCQSVKSLTLSRHYLHTDTLFFRTSALWASKLEVGLQLFSLQKHLSKQRQSQGQIWPVSVGDSSWQKFSRDNS